MGSAQDGVFRKIIQVLFYTPCFQAVIAMPSQQHEDRVT